MNNATHNANSPATAITIEMSEMATAQARASGMSVEPMVNLGLTKREHFAGLAMQGLISCDLITRSTQEVAEKRGMNPADIIGLSAVEFADALLAALEES